MAPDCLSECLKKKLSPQVIAVNFDFSFNVLQFGLGTNQTRIKVFTVDFELTLKYFAKRADYLTKREAVIDLGAQNLTTEDYFYVKGVKNVDLLFCELAVVGHF